MGGRGAPLADVKNLCMNAHNSAEVASYNIKPKYFIAVRGPTDASCAESRLNGQLRGALADLVREKTANQPAPFVWYAGHSSGCGCQHNFLIPFSKANPKFPQYSQPAWYANFNFIAIDGGGAYDYQAKLKMKTVRVIYAYQPSADPKKAKMESMNSFLRNEYKKKGFQTCGIKDTTSTCKTPGCLHARPFCKETAGNSGDLTCASPKHPEFGWLNPNVPCASAPFPPNTFRAALCDCV
jgi:hypothetical protein